MLDVGRRGFLMLVGSTAVAWPPAALGIEVPSTLLARADEVIE